MTYLEICKYVFSEERVDWELHTTKFRHRPIVQARQFSIYLGNWFIPSLTDRELAAVFCKDHATAGHALKTVRELMFSDKSIRHRMDKYLNTISANMKREAEETAQMATRRVAEEEAYKIKLLSTMNNMELIAKTYCDITGMELVKKAI